MLSFISQPQVLRLPGLVELLKSTWQIYKARWKTFLGIMILPVIVSFSFFIFGLGPISWLKILFFVIFILFYIAFWFWTLVSLLYAIKERDLKIGVKESFKKGWSKLNPFIWISFLAGFITFGGSLLFLVPGIIFVFWFILRNYVLVSEDLRGMSALLRSRQLVKGNWWPVFWRFLVISLIGIIAALTLISGADFLFPFFGDKISPIVNFVFNLFYTPFIFVFGFLIYEELKRQKEKIPFEPPKKRTKLGFILIGLAGILLIPMIIFTLIFLFS